MKYVGIDWGGDRHDVSLVDESGKRIDFWHVSSSPDGLVALMKRLAEEGGPSEVLVGMESGALPVLRALLRERYQTYVLNPKQADRFRDRHTVAGAKDDDLDSFVTADAVRTDRNHLKPYEPDTPLAEEIAIRDRVRTQMVQRRAALENQLRSMLEEYFPAMLKLGRPMEDPFFLDLLHLARDPLHVRTLRTSAVGRLVTKYRLRVLTAQKVLEVLRQPSFNTSAHVMGALRDGALQLATLIAAFNGQIEASETILDDLATKHPDYELLLSLPGLGDRSVVRVLAELGDSPSRRADDTSVQTYAGTAPVTRRTGRRGRKTNGRVVMRRGCNRILQAALFNMARASQASCAWAAAYLEDFRRRRVARVMALRSLSNKWAKIIAVVLRTHVPYDEARHVADLTRYGVEWAPKPGVAA